MRIKQIYITKEGEPMANPEMEYPIHGKSCEYSDCKCEIGDPCEAEKKYHSGLLPFENKDQEVESFVWDTVGVDAFTAKDGPLRFKPDTLIPVDLEAEVVEQVFGPGKWNDRMFSGDNYKLPSREYRKVLRIKP